jgi:hypothetical protein
MKIIQQLATWLLKNDRITPDEYQNVLTAIMGEIGDEGKTLLARSRVLERAQHAAEDSFETWWDLRGAGERAHVRATHRKGGRRPSQDATPVRVWDLDPQIADMLLPAGAAIDAFPLARLLLAVDGACGNHRTADWTGFAAAVDSLYKTDAEKLHDALLATMKAQGIAIGQILSDAEMGSTLFPEGFLSKLDGESVVALRKRIDGDETSFAMNKEDWILKYPSFNVLNEACLVRNRIRRIYRLWVKSFAEWDRYGVSNGGTPCICLPFGRTLVHVPAAIWWRLKDPGVPQTGSLRGIVAFPDGYPNLPAFLNILIDGKAVVLHDSKCVDPPEPPCEFGWIRKDGLDQLPEQVQLVLPIVRQNERVPVISWPEAPETFYWHPSDWLSAMAENRPLSNGVHPDDACPWRVVKMYPPYGVYWVILLYSRTDAEYDVPWDLLDTKGIPRKYWLQLLSVRPKFAQYAPWKDFNADELVSLFSKQPILRELCDINSISRYTLSSVFLTCPDCVESCLRHLTNGMSWAYYLSRHPEWAEYCPWQKLSDTSWSLLLQEHPEYADRCDMGKLGGWSWSEILRKQPQFADRCDWEKLDKWGWVGLLQVQPQFADHCAWEKLTEDAWSMLLQVQPQFADKCDWSKLSQKEKDAIVRRCPQLSAYAGDKEAS